MFRLRCGEVDLERRVVRRDGRAVDLTRHEVATLAFLHGRAGRVVAREELLRQVWGYAESSRSQAVHVAIRRLRAKIELDPSRPDHLKTVEGVGWVLELPPESPAAEVPTPGSAEVGPPARSDRAASGLVGRDRLLDDVRAAMAASPVVMLVGPGGIGKTTLARAILAEERGVFVDLAAAQTRGELEAAVARALRADDPARALPSAGWVVLDNLEQLGAEIIDPVSAWSEAGARLLLTSRIRVPLPRTSTVAVGPLEEADAVALLVRCARAVGAPDLDPADPVVHELARVLEHNPLCLELAAPRTRLLSPPDLLRRLEDRFVVLRTRDPGRPERHSALDASINGSWRLLDEPARRALADLTAFRAAFRADAAEAVLGDGALDTLQELLDASLVCRARTADDRLDLYVSVREFVERRAQPSPEAIESHGRWFAAFDPNVAGAADVADLEAAIERALARGDAAIAVPCVYALATAGSSMVVPGVLERIERALPIAEGLGRIRLVRMRAKHLARTSTEAALAALADLAPEDPLQLGLTHEQRGQLLIRLGDLEQAERELQHALAAFERAGKLENQVTARTVLANLLGRRGRASEARAVLLEALRQSRDLDHVRIRAAVLATLSTVAIDRREAIGFTRDAIGVLDRVGDQQAGLLRSNLAQFLLAEASEGAGDGVLDEAEALAERAWEQLGPLELRGRALAGSVRGMVAEARGRLDEARGWYLGALDDAERYGDRRVAAAAKRHLAVVVREQGEAERALVLLDEAIATFESLGDREELAKTLRARSDSRERP